MNTALTYYHPLNLFGKHVSIQLPVYTSGRYEATLELIWSRVSHHLVNVKNELNESGEKLSLGSSLQANPLSEINSDWSNFKYYLRDNNLSTKYNYVEFELFN